MAWHLYLCECRKAQLPRLALILVFASVASWHTPKGLSCIFNSEADYVGSQSFDLTLEVGKHYQEVGKMFTDLICEGDQSGVSALTIHKTAPFDPAVVTDIRPLILRGCASGEYLSTDGGDAERDLLPTLEGPESSCVLIVVVGMRQVADMDALRSRQGESNHLITVLREEIQMHREQVRAHAYL